MSDTLDDGLDFGGYPQPPDVPPDPTGDDWRGPPGPAGPPGPGAAPSNTVPLMDGVGAPGTAGTASRGDHVHPSDYLSVLSFLPAGQPDGITDNASSINTAIAAAAGRTLVFPVTAHNYMVHGLSVPSNSHLIIQGTLQLMAGQTGYILVHAPNAMNIIIEGTGTLDGNKANQTAPASGGIGGDGGTNIIIRNLTIQNTYNWPINLTNTTHGRVEDVTMTNGGNSCEFAIASHDCRFIGCKVSGIADLGLGFYGGAVNGGIVNCVVTACNDGIFILNDNGQPAASNYILIQGNISYNNPGAGIIVASNVSPLGAYHGSLTIQNNICYGNTQGGIVVNVVNNVLVEDNLCYLNHYISMTPGVSGDIWLGNYVQLGKVSGNSLINCMTGGTAGFGIGLYLPNFTQVSGNFFDDTQTTKSMAGAIGGTTGQNCSISGNHYGTFIGVADQVTYANNSIQGFSYDANSDTIIGGVRATGSTTPRMLGDRFAEVVNIKDFGATGTGTVDDASRINAALTACRALTHGWTLVFPPGQYLVGTPLNFTGFNDGNLHVIQGEGATIIGQMNGGIVVDCTDSRWMYFYGLHISGNGSNVPTIGIRFGMATNTRGADYNRMTGCMIDGYFARAAWYNNCSEMFVGKDCYLSNGTTAAGAYVAISDGVNHFNVPSTFVTVTQPAETAQSNNSTVWIQSAFQGTNAGGVLWLAFCIAHRYVGCYASNNASGGTVVVIYQMATGGHTVVDLDLDLHMEPSTLAHAVTVTGPAGVTSAAVDLLTFRDVSNQAGTSVFNIDPASVITSVSLTEATLELNGPAPALVDTPAAWTISTRYANLGSNLWGAVGHPAPSRGPTEVVTATNATAQLTINANAGQAKMLQIQSATVPRWALLAASDAESGSNAGSTLQLQCFADSGSLIATPLSGQRSTGNLTFNNLVSFQSEVFANASGTGLAVAHNATVGGTLGVTGATTFGGGTLFGSTFAGNNSDLSHHLALYGTTYGLNVVSNEMNYVTPSGAIHVFLVGGGAVASFSSSGFAVGAGLAITGAAHVTNGSGGPNWTGGAGAPVGTQPNGSIYSRTDGTTGARLYVCSGAAWLPVAGV